MRRWIHNRVTTFLIPLGMIAVLLTAVVIPGAAAQNSSKNAAYDSIGSNAETYAGPARGGAWDLPGSTIYIGLLAPMHGPEMAQGDALIAAANMALQDSIRRPLPGGRHVKLAIGDESGPAWGHVSEVILKLVQQQNVVALITSTNGTDTHVSEQVGNRIGVPILTLSSDATSTQIDIPWIFRLGPSDTMQAQTIANKINAKPGLKKVMVISTEDHDGRAGAAAMRQATGSMGTANPEEIVLDSQNPDFPELGRRISKDPPQAIIFWTSPNAAQSLLPMLRAKQVSATMYLSLQAAQAVWKSQLTSIEDGEDIAANSVSGWTIASGGKDTAARKNFATRYRQETGRMPSAAAAEAYDAVCLTVRALRLAGPNRARMRDQLSRTDEYSGASGIITFDREGNNSTQVHLVPLQQQKTSPATAGDAE